MLIQVIKSSGKLMPFEAKKIKHSITRAAVDAKLTPEEINKVVSEVSNVVVRKVETKNKINSSEIKDLILSELDVLAPAVSVEWRKFVDAKKK